MKKALWIVLCIGFLAPSTLRAQEANPASVAIESGRSNGFALDRQKLPKVMRATPLDRFSSGALRLFDQGGNLVHSPSGTRAESKQAAAPESVNAALDPRVGANLRLGNDPSQLPSTMRAQAEPHIARHPANPDLLAATFQEGRFTTGGAVDCGYAISHDGGLSWSRALIPGLTPVVGGPYYRATDPVAGFDLNGVIYLNTLALLDSSLATSALLLSRSTNGGASFEPPVEVMRSPDSSVLLDKNWMAVNTFPGTPHVGRIVLTITRFDSSYYPIACTFSDDGGRTWAPNTFVTVSNGTCQGSQPVFLPDGKLAVVFWQFSPSDRLEVALSTNGGDTFNSPRLIATVTRYDAPGIRDGAFLPSATTDRTLGQLFVTFQGLYQGTPRVLFTKSADAGTTWTSPKPISDNPTNSLLFNPAIAVSPDGQVVSGVFYDGRMNPSNANLVDLFLAQSFDGGNTWQPNLRLTTVSSDVRLAPLTASGYMLGDYLGVAPSTHPDVPAVPVWIDTRAGSPDPFIVRVGMAPQVSFASWRAARFSSGQINNPLQGGAGMDPDGDGVVNLLEYAFGLDPWSGDGPNFSASSSGPGPAAIYTTAYKRISAANDLDYSWMTTTDSRTWSTIVPSNVVVTPQPDRHTEVVTSSFPSGTNTHQFYRLGVSLKN